MPEHFRFLSKKVRSRLLLERSYGNSFGYSDDYFTALGCSMGERDEILRVSDVVVLPKPTPDDVGLMREGAVLFGWAHLVQQRAMTQAAVENRITVIAWEDMNQWDSYDQKLMHLFYRNNELAGYSAVLHCLELMGIDGHYGPRREVIILGYGSVSRGAIYALQGRGFNNIHVFTSREPHLVRDKNPDVYHGRFYTALGGEYWVTQSDYTNSTLIERLSKADVIINGVLQDPNAPLLFLRTSDVVNLRENALIIDVSCDEGMGFEFARPTTFDEPYFLLANGVKYYSVGHTPTYLWNAASREISHVVISQIEKVARGPEECYQDRTLARATHIRRGEIINPAILQFQNRAPTYPHRYL